MALLCELGVVSLAERGFYLSGGTFLLFNVFFYTIPLPVLFFFFFDTPLSGGHLSLALVARVSEKADVRCHHLLTSSYTGVV